LEIDEDMPEAERLPDVKKQKKRSRRPEEDDRQGG
jgi:hypothetical protein